MSHLTREYLTSLFFSVWSHVAVIAEHVNVANVRSVTRVLDAWGKHIFNEIKTLLHSQPNTLLPDYSRYSAVLAHLHITFFITAL